MGYIGRRPRDEDLVVAMVGDDGTDATAPDAAAKPLVGSGYHLVGVPLAAGAPAPIGFATSMPGGALPMSLSAGVAALTERRV
jgi:hypothetical protein